MNESAIFIAACAFVAGYLLACWRVSRKTGVPMSQILRGGGNGEER